MTLDSQSAGKRSHSPFWPFGGGGGAAVVAVALFAGLLLVDKHQPDGQLGPQGGAGDVSQPGNHDMLSLLQGLTVPMLDLSGDTRPTSPGSPLTGPRSPPSAPGDDEADGLKPEGSTITEPDLDEGMHTRPRLVLLLARVQKQLLDGVSVAEQLLKKSQFQVYSTVGLRSTGFPVIMVLLLLACFLVCAVSFAFQQGWDDLNRRRAARSQARDQADTMARHYLPNAEGGRHMRGSGGRAASASTTPFWASPGPPSHEPHALGLPTTSPPQTQPRLPAPYEQGTDPLNPISSQSLLSPQLGESRRPGTTTAPATGETGAASSVGLPPPLCPTLVLPVCEARFGVRLYDLAQVSSEGALNIVGLSGNQLLRAAVRTSGSRRTLEISMPEAGSAPRATVGPPMQEYTTEASTRVLEIRGFKGAFYGTLEMRQSGACYVTQSGRTIMAIDGETDSLQLTIKSYTGQALASVRCSNEPFGGVDHVEVRVEPGVDPVLILSCVLAVLLLSSYPTTD